MLPLCAYAVFMCLTIACSQGTGTTSTTATAAATTPVTTPVPEERLLETEAERLGELSRQVAETNRALEELLAAKLRDVHYASVIGDLRSEIDALR